MFHAFFMHTCQRSCCFFFFFQTKPLKHLFCAEPPLLCQARWLRARGGKSLTKSDLGINCSSGPESVPSCPPTPPRVFRRTIPGQGSQTLATGR